MSIDTRYLTNGEKTAYTLLHADTGEVEEFARLEDIPASVRHYFSKMDKPKMCGPDLACILGVSKVFYPGWPKKCTMKGCEGRRCVGESCAYTTTPMDWKNCPFISDNGAKPTNPFAALAPQEADHDE